MQGITLMVHIFFLGYVLSIIINPEFDKLGIIIYGCIGLLIRLKNYNIIYFFDILLLWIMYLIYSLLFIYDYSLLLYICLFILQYGLMYYIYANLIKNDKNFSKWSIQIIVYQVIIVIIGIIDLVLYKFGYLSILHDYHNWRIDSLYTNPNAFGIMSALIFLLLFYMNSNLHNLKFYKNLFLFVLFIGILISGSRMSLLLLFVGIFFKYVSIKSLMYLISSLGITLIFLLFFLDLEIVYEIFNKRIEIWTAAIEIFKDNSLVGIGTGMFQKTAEVHIEDTIKENIWGLHSMYLWLIIETGIVGMVIYVIFIIRVLQININSEGYRKILLLILLSQTTEFFLDHVEYFQLFFYFIIAIIAKEYYIKERNKYEKNFIS